MAFLSKSVFPSRAPLLLSDEPFVFPSLPKGRVVAQNGRLKINSMRTFNSSLKASDGHHTWDLRWEFPVANPDGNPLFQHAQSSFSIDIRSGMLDVGCCDKVPAVEARKRTTQILAQLEEDGRVDLPFRVVQKTYGTFLEAVPEIAPCFEFLRIATVVRGDVLQGRLLSRVDRSATVRVWWKSGDVIEENYVD